MQRDGVGQIVFGHQIIHQRLTGGLIDRIDYAETTGEREHMPITDETEKDDKPVDRRLDHPKYLSGHHQTAAIDAVGERAADSAKKQPGHAVEKTHDPQKKSRLG